MLRRTLWTLAALLVLVTSNLVGQRIGRYADGYPAVEDFIVAKGSAAGSFAFSAAGDLTYNGRPFSPPVHLNYPDNYTAFRVSVLHGKNEGLATAIAKDIDGKDSLYILDLRKGTVREFGGNASIDLFFERSGRYVVVLYQYEGSSLASIDLEAKQVVARADLAPDDKGRFWIIKDGPAWTEDALSIAVNETCNPYEENCNIEQVLARYTLLIHPASLRIAKVRR
jgi:hypothetical protein